MATISYDGITHTADSIGEWLVTTWPDLKPPAGLRVFHNGVDITERGISQPHEFVTPSDAHYDVVTVPEISATVLAWVAVVISVASVLLAPKIDVPANVNRQQESPNNSLGNRANRARLNQRSADIRGKVTPAYPDLIQVPYRKFIAGVEYEFLYAQVTEGSAECTDIRDGNTEFSKIQGSRLAIYGPGTSPISGTPQLTIGGNIPDTLYEVTQSNEIDGATLKAPNDPNALVQSWSASSDGTIYGTGFESVFSPGGSITLNDFNCLVQYDDFGESALVSLNGTYNILAVYSDRIVVDAYWPVGFENPIIVIGYQDITISSLWFSSPRPNTTEVVFNPSITAFTVTNGIGPINITGYERVWCNIIAQNGLYTDDGTDVTPISVGAAVTVYELNSSGVRTGAESTLSATLSALVGEPRQFTGMTMDVSNPYAYAEIVVYRWSDTDLGFTGTVVDEIKWRDLYLVNSVPSIDASNTTTVHAVIKSTPTALRIKDRRLNMQVIRKTATYLGNRQFSATDNHISPNFADVIASICRDPYNGGMTDTEVDWDNLYETQQQIIDYFGDVRMIQVGYTFDSDTITPEEQIRLICDAVNVTAYRVGSVLSFNFERPQSQSAMQFGHRQKIPGTDQRSRSFENRDGYDGVELTWQDADSKSTRTIVLPAASAVIKPLKIEYGGCIYERAARVRANREYNKLRYGRVTHTFDATEIGRLVAPNMRVDVVDNTRRSGFDGEVRGVSGRIVTVSQPVTLMGAGPYYISFTQSDGTLEFIEIQQQLDQYRLQLATAPTDVSVSRLADRTPYNIGTDDQRSKIAMIVRDFDVRSNRVSITCQNYDSRYYSGDL